MIRTVTLDRNQKPTKEQIRQIEEAAKKEIVYDENSPELTLAIEKAFIIKQQFKTDCCFLFFMVMKSLIVPKSNCQSSLLAFLCQSCPLRLLR